jgi:cyclophilin family peptidyl-prolyl cis-trans isomerase
MASKRHILVPPIGGKLSLVCCSTTAGPLEIVVYYKWAPFCAEGFMEMVTSGYFTSGIPLMQCIKGFLCKFGLNSDPAKRQDFQETFPDNGNWLPEGKAF